MTDAPPREDRLIDHLIDCATREDRGALAALKTGLGKPPGGAPRMFPVIARCLHKSEGPAMQAAFITASLFALQPEHRAVGTIGASLHRATAHDDAGGGKHGLSGVERRFAAALDAHAEDLPRHLQGLVALCASAGVPIDWYQFHRDLRGLLGANEEYQNLIRTRWAKDFWRGPKADKNENETNKENEES